MMIVYHVTPAANRESIEEHGLLRACSTNPLRRIWMVDFPRLDWADRHIRARYKTEDVVAFKFAINARALRCWRSGVYFVENRDIRWTTIPLIAVYLL